MADTNNPDGGNNPSEGGQAPDSNNNGANDGGNGNGDQGGSSGNPNPEPQPTEPKVRGNNAFFAGMRVAKKQAAQNPNPDNSGDGGEGQGAGDKGGDEGVNINAAIEERMNPILQQQAAIQVNSDIATYLNDNPEFKEFADTVRSFAAHPSRANVPIDTLFLEVAGGAGKLSQIFADRSKTALEKQNNSQASGTAARLDGRKIDWLKATPEEVEKEQQRIREGR